MLLYRGLFLAALISAVGIAFADILVQPHSAYRYNVEPNNAAEISPPARSTSYNGPCYEPITHKWYSMLPDQQVAAAYPQHAQHTSSQVKSAYGDLPYYLPITGKWYSLLPNQHVGVTQPQLMEIQTIPTYPWVDPSAPITARRHVSYTKIGGHGYKRPTVIFKYPKSVRRYRRSTEATSADSSKAAIATHVDDVAAQSTLIDEKPPTLIDFLLPKNQPTDNNNKHVTSRQIQNDHTQELLLQSLPVDASTSKQSDEQSPASIKAVVAEQAQLVIPQEEQLDRLYEEAFYPEQQNAYQEFDSKLLQENTQVEGTKSPRKILHKTIIFIKPLIPTNDWFDSISNIFKRKLTNAQEQYNNYPLPLLKYLQKTQDGIKSFTHNSVDHIPNIKIFELTPSWLKKLLGKDKDVFEYLMDFGSPLVYSLDNSDDYSDDELSSPRAKYSNTICFLSNNNCITYEISDTEDNMDSIHVSHTEDD